MLKDDERYQVSREFAVRAISHATHFIDEIPQRALATVKIEMLLRGVPKECARIYRLPKETTEREKWLAYATIMKEKVFSHFSSDPFL